ncbi:MAG: (E)-4-hydroxy-3-methylbut-2-enyl-diphosphate synthase [Bacteroidales bacterium]|nr:(E)-4-hydroxy-3-methylbut-2-enyl-diphosphate synthase [Bacteroidales bacterium]
MKIHIGSLEMGEGAPVVVQSMTNTETCDIAATVAQAMRMVEAGCQMVRITVPSMKEVSALGEIKQRLRAEGIAVPLVADVHFLPQVAEACAAIVEKVRVNPGNYVDKRNFSQLDLTDVQYAESLQTMAVRARPLLEICRQHNTALRIGVNHGSLCDRIVSRYGNTPLAMAMSALEWIDICESAGFHNLVLSLKSSNVNTMAEATRMLHGMMQERGEAYPLHLGVTEAGAGDEGRMKSAVGIGALLLDSIGDTIRVSLTEPPENEVPFARLIASATGEKDRVKVALAAQTLHLCYDEPDRQKWMAVAGSFIGHAHLHHAFSDLVIENRHFSCDECKYMAELALQACRIRMTRTEIVSCPSCGRTRYDIMGTLEKVKQRFSHYPNLKIGVMGCIVNGPGEMADADFGIVGATDNKVIVYKQKEKLTPPLEVDAALDFLHQLILNNNYSKNL